ncbi:MAG: nucleotidyltransferase substrate binding protein [Bdellovibrio sp.]|nr:nucleotidyltransferase substrate binding protein [Bdellovibrio sp.]
MSQKLLELFKSDFVDALGALEHSWMKLKNQPIPHLEKKDLEALEPWEALTARFARTTDIFLSKYIRFLILNLDPGFRGEIRDYLDKAEKAQFIVDADQWMKIRELRNKISHEYSKVDLEKTLKDVVHFTPFVLKELEKFKS